MDGSFEKSAGVTKDALFKIEWENPYLDHCAISVQRALQVNSVCNKGSAYVVAETAEVAEQLGMNETDIIQIRNTLGELLDTKDTMFFDMPDLEGGKTSVMLVSLEALWDNGIKPYGMEGYLSPSYQEQQPEVTSETLVAQ